jgi:SAM-dependent methyltransferase
MRCHKTFSKKHAARSRSGRRHGNGAASQASAVRTDQAVSNAAALQKEYYERTAATYDRRHLSEDGEHEVACRLISAFIPMLGATSLLDVGCGTGRAIGFFRANNPRITTHGVEPVPALLDEARAKFGCDGLFRADGVRLPFRDNSYDIVIETGVLHHVKRPADVVCEMTRVARKAVFLSDHNIFGQGSRRARSVKWALYMTGLWGVTKRLLNRGRDYHESEGDGIAYSYSVYFQYRLLQRWASRVMVIPTRNGNGGGDLGLYSPLFSADEVLLCAIRSENSDL